MTNSNSLLKYDENIYVQIYNFNNNNNQPILKSDSEARDSYINDYSHLILSPKLSYEYHFSTNSSIHDRHCGVYQLKN